MAQHYLLSAEARNLSIIKLATMSNDEAFESLKLLDEMTQMVNQFVPVVVRLKNLIF